MAIVEVRPLTLYGIEGHLLRCNDVVFQPALPTSAEPRALAQQRTLVFFGGDIQNLSYLMDHTDKVVDYRKWCLETTALRLSIQFPSCHVVVVKPSRVVFDHISCFDNFVESNHLGIPKHYYHYMALMHLDKLLQTLSKTIRHMDPDVLFKMLLQSLDEEELQEKHNIENGTVWQYENMPAERKRVLITWQRKLRLDMYQLKLVAFSKGCVVLNQFLYEFHYARGLEPLHKDSCIIERIRDMYWLDSGNCGRQNVYLTSMGILRTLTFLEIIVHVHVSMYMTEDENRPWIAEQFNEFIQGIKASNGNVLHFRHVSPTDDLVSHFEVLMQFKYTEKKHIKCINSPRVRRQRKLPSDEELPAQVAPEPTRTRLRRKRPSHNESIGLCLVNLHDSPYLGLQISVQKHALPLKATEARLSCPPHPNFVQTVPARYRSIRSTSLTPADLPILTQMPLTPVQTTSAQIPANSVMVRHEPMSVQTPSAPVQTTTSTQITSTPAEPSMSVQTPSDPVLTSSAHMPATSVELSMMSVQTPSAPVQTTSAVMPSTPAEPSMSCTPVRKPPPSGLVWSSGQLPKNHKDYTVLLLNEISYSFSDEEAIDYKNSPYYNIHAPVVALPNYRNPLRMHVYAPDKELYVPKLYNHHYVVNRKNEKDEGEELPSFFANEEPPPPPAADDLEPAAFGPTNATATSDPDTRHATSSSNSTTSPSGRNATGPVGLTPSARSDVSDSSVSNPDSNISDSDSDVSASESDLSSSSETSGPVNSRVGSRLGRGRTLSGSSQVEAVSDNRAFTSLSGPATSDPGSLGSHITSVPQLSPNTADHPVRSQRATSRSAQREVSQNRVDTPRDEMDTQSTPPGSQMANSSQDSIAPRAGTSGARDIDDEPLYRYNLRKRIKRSYDENILHIQFQ